MRTRGWTSFWPSSSETGCGCWSGLRLGVSRAVKSFFQKNSSSCGAGCILAGFGVAERRLDPAEDGDMTGWLRWGDASTGRLSGARDRVRGRLPAFAGMTDGVAGCYAGQGWGRVGEGLALGGRRDVGRWGVGSGGRGWTGSP